MLQDTRLFERKVLYSTRSRQGIYVEEGVVLQDTRLVEGKVPGLAKTFVYLFVCIVYPDGTYISEQSGVRIMLLSAAHHTKKKDRYVCTQESQTIRKKKLALSANKFRS